MTTMNTYDSKTLRSRLAAINQKNIDEKDELVSYDQNAEQQDLHLITASRAYPFNQSHAQVDNDPVAINYKSMTSSSDGTVEERFSDGTDGLAT